MYDEDELENKRIEHIREITINLKFSKYECEKIKTDVDNYNDCSKHSLFYVTVVIIKCLVFGCVALKIYRVIRKFYLEFIGPIKTSSWGLTWVKMMMKIGKSVAWFVGVIWP